MERPEWNPKLSQLSTEWSLVFQAHSGSPEQVALAQVALMGRYAGAVHRYLVAALHDSDAASDLDQEFALRFLRGDFQAADPARGRFRDFVRRALRNLMTDYRRRAAARPRTLGSDIPEVADPAAENHEFDRQFLASWRSELMARAWDALAQLQETSQQPYHTILRLRVDHPELRSPELAERLSAALGRTITAGGLRVALQRARDRFVEFLLDEVKTSLTAPTDDELEQELIDLGLHTYCQPVLKRLGRTPKE